MRQPHYYKVETDGYLPVHRGHSAPARYIHPHPQDLVEPQCPRYRHFNAGISYKTQEIYAVVFLSRYVDIFMGWKTFYFFIMKIVLIFGTMYTAYLIRMKKPFMLTYNASEDSFPHYYLYAAAAIFTMIIHKSFLPFELIWSYSIWLEALAILPQLSVIMKSGEV